MKNPFRTLTREELLLTTLERLEREKLTAQSVILEADNNLDLIRRKISTFQYELNLLQGKVIPPPSPEVLAKNNQAFPDIPH